MIARQSFQASFAKSIPPVALFVAILQTFLHRRVASSVVSFVLPWMPTPRNTSFIVVNRMITSLMFILLPDALERETGKVPENWFCPTLRSFRLGSVRPISWGKLPPKDSDLSLFWKMKIVKGHAMRDLPFPASLENVHTHALIQKEYSKIP
ncbi:hypothetical protein Vadar_030773 [Vaccinium darrowii]|uniref:Uncharacterized protein n=1 Tax=Vaccinium darrowii TaxID=229202 RepID=A0ACB7XL21_9ERIC|nr:hypothetical protein Vadar_030773 [Vaccinium darrowii]